MTRAWQIVMTLLAAFAIVNFASNFFGNANGGTFGFATSTGRASGTATVQSVDRGGPAQQAGIRTGDVVTFDPTYDFLAKILSPLVGDQIVVHDKGRTITLTAIGGTQSTPSLVFLLFFAFGKLAFLAIALLIVWRRPNEPAARALAVFLVAFGLTIAENTSMFVTPASRIALYFVGQLSLMAGGIGVYAFTAYFPGVSRSSIGRFMRATLIPAVVLGFVTGAGSIITTFLGGKDALLVRVFSLSYMLLYVFLIVCAVAALVVSYRKATGDERARMRWTMMTFAIGFSGLVAFLIAIAAGARIELAQYFAITVLVIPFGLAYAILRHRVVDIGFVVNRAVVYTGVSVIVVGAFVLFEWLLSHVVEENSRASVLFQLAGALALGFSVRYVHERVDRYVDDFFFRDRHAAEQAIRRFAHEAALITDPDILVKRTVDVAQRNGKLNGAAFYAQREGRFIPLHSTFEASPEIDENDPVVLDMRAFREVVHLHGTETLVPGETVFPMVVRGQLSGFLACGAKTNHEALAPDEAEALRILSRDAGTALDSLRIARIEAELGFLTTDSELPSSLRMRLSSLLSKGDGTQPAGVATRFSQ